MAESLRDRKKAATMRHVQLVAIDLFEERGFNAVRVEEIAAAADVSPSTVYRYFGTKEGLVIHDEHDDLLFEAVEEALAEHSLQEVADQALALIDHDHFRRDAELTLRRTKLWFDVPTVRAAALVSVDRWVDDLTGMVLASPHHDYAPDEARIRVASLLWGLIAAIECWYRAGAEGSLGDYLRARLTLVSPATAG
ncbi:TetR/AcrR family transcriptional regulator [Granulicoccus sp. GXG6511]|uniref:TetR/AcrR family transcriptional regulator n=1 Tax=Granulicoccus sp. GXG6511 TaxID=3381351 RepID=UPI003D7DFC31